MKNILHFIVLCILHGFVDVSVLTGAAFASESDSKEAEEEDDLPPPEEDSEDESDDEDSFSSQGDVGGVDGRPSMPRECFHNGCFNLRELSPLARRAFVADARQCIGVSHNIANPFATLSLAALAELHRENGSRLIEVKAELSRLQASSQEDLEAVRGDLVAVKVELARIQAELIAAATSGAISAQELASIQEALTAALAVGALSATELAQTSASLKSWKRNTAIGAAALVAALGLGVGVRARLLSANEQTQVDEQLAVMLHPWLVEDDAVKIRANLERKVLKALLVYDLKTLKAVFRLQRAKMSNKNVSPEKMQELIKNVEALKLSPKKLAKIVKYLAIFSELIALK